MPVVRGLSIVITLVMISVFILVTRDDVQSIGGLLDGETGGVALRGISLFLLFFPYALMAFVSVFGIISLFRWYFRYSTGT